ncbi:MAG TPA: hypothetical protein ACN46Y_08675 [Prochlorococcus sp.]
MAIIKAFYLVLLIVGGEDTPFKIEAISTASEAECVELGMKLKGKDEGKMFNCLTKEQMSIWLTKLYGTGTGSLG